MTKRTILTALAAGSMLALTACGSDGAEDAEGGGEISSGTLAALIEDQGELSTTADILGDTGLQNVFDGNAPYTIFAPTDDAFEALEIPLEGEEAQAARVAILREHIVPGFLTRDDIVGAIESGGGSVEMQTMGSNTLTFSEDGDTLLVASSDGTEARVAGAGMSGANGSVFPIDGVLKSTDEPD
ncbi:fasciclin domain-containing protein [Aurantiacibacter odishensis]|uniref:fasciclin domain-containing protein n=1 Tax=Aurantiacibacter odishensis TaxID=1155476 RepID=UPI000E732A0E|nr:fasciclin domain-containing protein [Aurantiacibacter odishensis]